MLVQLFTIEYHNKYCNYGNSHFFRYNYLYNNLFKF